MFDLEKFRSGEYYVHLPTLELYREVMKFLDNKGFLWIDGENLTNDKAYLKHMSETCIRYKRSGYLTQGLAYADLDFYKEKGYKQLEINKYEKGDDNMNEKMKRDLVKLLFEKEFSVLLNLGFIMQYEGRLITNSFHNTTKLIDFIDVINDKYDIKGHEVAKIIIEEFDLEEYREEE